MIRSVAVSRPRRERAHVVLRLLPPALFVLALIVLAAVAGAQPRPEVGAADPASPQTATGPDLQALLGFLLVAFALALGLGWGWRKP